MVLSEDNVGNTSCSAVGTCDRNFRVTGIVLKIVFPNLQPVCNSADNLHFGFGDANFYRYPLTVFGCRHSRPLHTAFIRYPTCGKTHKLKLPCSK
jgi:hypothetical protein